MVFVLIAALLLCGCASVEQAYVPDTLPQLIKQEPLPPWPFRTIANEVTLDIKIRIAVTALSRMSPSLLQV